MDETAEKFCTPAASKTQQDDPLADRERALRACPVFSHLCDKDLIALASHTQAAHYGQGQLLMRRGVVSAHVLVITRGVAQVSVSAANGQEFIIGMVGRNTLLGDCWRELEPQSVDVTAYEPINALLITRHSLQVLDPLVLTKGFNLLMAERLLGTLETLEDLALFNLRPRLARLLTRMHKNATSNPAGRLTRYNQGILAAMAGATRPRVNEHLQYFRQIGAIEIQAGLVLIRQVALLEQEIGASLDTHKIPRAVPDRTVAHVSAP